MSTLLFQNGNLAAEDQAQLTAADVRVADGKITAVAPGLKPEKGETVIDCNGKVILPALFDVHVHVREPGREDKETIETGSRAAVNGGVTGYVAMPNTNPAIDTAAMVRFVLNLAREKSQIPVYACGCISKGREGRELAEMADMLEKGAVMFTDDGSPVEDASLLRRAMDYARDFDVPLASHCEVASLSGDGAMNEGFQSYKLGIAGIPAISEEICLDRDIRLGQYTGAHIHIQHVTSARGMETIRRFKEEGVRVTCEVTPHHLIFCDDDIVDYNTHYKMNPPLRTAADREALLQGLLDGVFDVIATDHAPHTVFEKDLDFGHAPFGITGLETALPSLYTHFIKPGKFDWGLLVKRYSAEPRRLIKLDPVPVAEGGTAEFVVFDPEAVTHFDKDFMQSKSVNTPFLDQDLQGRVDQVVYEGRILLDRQQPEAG